MATRWFLALSVCLAAIGPLSCAAPAQASVSQFGEEGAGAGQFNEARGVAVDQGSGDVYVVDRNNERVDEFSSEGTFLLAWGWGVADGKSELETCGPDATPSTETCKVGLSGSGAGQFEGAGGIAINNDPLSASHGDVYVEDIGNRRVQEFTPEGHFLLMFGGEVNATTTGDVCLAGETCQKGLEAESAVPGAFEPLSPNAIAVDSAGTVYVGDLERVQEFNEGGALTKQVTLTGLGFIEALTVDSSADIYVMSGEGVRKFDSSGTELGTPRDPTASGFVSVIAVGPAGELFVDNQEARRLVEFGADGEQLASFDASTVEEGAFGLALGETIDRLYVLHASTVQLVGLPPAGPLVESEEAVAEPVGTATVKASFDAERHPEVSEEEVAYRFEYDTREYKEGEGPHGTSTPLENTSKAPSFQPRHAEAHLSGLQPATLYHFRVLVTNAANETTAGPDQTFTTLPALSIDSESVSQVSSTSALLAGELNPLGSETRYAFSYGPTSACGSSECTVPAGEGDAGSGVGDVPISVLVEGLSPGTTYHYRLTAHNALAPPQGIADPERTFTTQEVGGESKPAPIDGRGWEMVSPPEKHGAALDALTLEGGDIQAAEDGGGLAYIAKAPPDGEPEGNRSLAETQLLASHGADGWETKDIATPHEAVAGLFGGELSEYRLFAPDLATGVVEPTGATPLSATASERTPYRRETNGEYLPLVSGCPPITSCGTWAMNCGASASSDSGNSSCATR